MKFVEFFSNIAMPFMIVIIIIYGLVERKKVFDIFLDGAKEGIEVVFNIFPTLVGLFVAIGALRSSGIIGIFVKVLTPIFNIFNFGVDSNIGLIASVIMGSTETTVYTIAVYTGSVGIKKTRFVLWAALTADFVGIITSIIICKIF